jgi:hypothetical protein
MSLKTVSAVAALVLMSGFANAGANCQAHPTSEWMKEADAKARLVQEGYTIKTFKVTGNCYELYGKDKAGKRVEIYFDTKTMEVVKMDE